MEFVPLYPNAVAPDKIIDNLIALLGDDEYQAGALAWASPDEPLEPYVLISESAVWREVKDFPALVIRDVTADGLKDNGQSVGGVLRFTVYQCLAMPDGADATDALMREAYRRNLAVDMMLRGLPATEVFKDTGVGGRGKLFVVRRDYGETEGGDASYRRVAGVTVEIRLMEGA